MTASTNSKQPSLAVLTARFLARPSDFDATAAVEPHEMLAGFATEPRLAWNESIAILKWQGFDDRSCKMPADWAGYVRQSPTCRFLPIALGQFPQQVRDVAALLADRAVDSHAPVARSWTPSAPSGQLADFLLAAAADRVANHFEEADRWLNKAESLATTATERELLANERAAIAWQRGDRATATAIWQSLPDSGSTAFNLGVAALADGNKAMAVVALSNALKSLPDSSSWYHLAQLYLALAR